jgi:hypothetical protein
MSVDVTEGHNHFSIHKRPSGGRGEYELVGRQDAWTPADLWEKPFQIITRFGVKESNVYVGNQGGKRRFRRLDSSGPSHPQIQLAAMLMMPESTRDESHISGGLPVLIEKRYVLDVNFRIQELSTDFARIEPFELIARSSGISDRRTRERIDFEERARRVHEVHERVDELPDVLARLVKRHAILVRREFITNEVARTVRGLMQELAAYDTIYLPGADPLPALRALVGIPIDLESSVPEPPDIPADEPEVRLRAERIYRLRRSRGAGAARFRVLVQRAYDFRCAFCGLRAPTVSNRMASGVDAAHILPWGSYDLDVTQNGIMLCKQHHWAFDNRVLRLDYVNAGYFVSLVESAREQFGGDAQTLGLLEGACGRVSEQLLPSQLLRPSPAFICEYNSLSV